MTPTGVDGLIEVKDEAIEALHTIAGLAQAMVLPIAAGDQEAIARHVGAIREVAMAVIELDAKRLAAEERELAWYRRRAAAA